MLSGEWRHRKKENTVRDYPDKLTVVYVDQILLIMFPIVVCYIYSCDDNNNKLCRLGGFSSRVGRYTGGVDIL